MNSRVDEIRSVLRKKRNGCDGCFDDTPCRHCFSFNLVTFCLRLLPSYCLLPFFDLSLPGMFLSSVSIFKFFILDFRLVGSTVSHSKNPTICLRR